MNKISALWTGACAHAAAHREAYHHTLHASHFAYLLTVVLHGPYTLAAFGCMLTLIVGYAFRLEMPYAPHPGVAPLPAVVPPPSRLG